MISTLCQYPYWRRLWIVQELILAKAAFIAMGATDIDIDIMDSLLRPYGTLKEIQRYRYQSAWGENLQLSTLLVSFRYSVCSLPQDRIYGLLGLVGKDAIQIIDYQCCNEQIFADILRCGNDSLTKIDRARHKLENAFFFMNVLDINPDGMLKTLRRNGALSPLLTCASFSVRLGETFTTQICAAQARSETRSRDYHTIDYKC